MKTKSKITALMIVVLMLLTQIPFSVFAATENTLTPDTLYSGRVWDEYSKELEFIGETTSPYFSIADGGMLPPGLSLTDTHTCHPMIKGTPTKAGLYTFTILAKDGYDRTLLEKTYTMTILPDYPLNFQYDELPHGYEGNKYSYGLDLTHFRSADKWKMEAEEGKTLPDGLEINSTTGRITWETPVCGQYNLNITAIRKGNSISKVFKLIVEPEGGCKHQNTTKKAGKTATCEENGLVDSWHCNDCDYNFLDEECKNQTWLDVNKLYTTAFHSDENGDKVCDKCEKQMPVFKKVTDENEITNLGMYLVVSNIGGKYYTLKISESGEESIGATEITPESDGTFAYPKADTKAMVLKTEFVAECGELGAGKPRYGFVTFINGIPYTLEGADSSYYLMMNAYEESKYGYRISFKDEKPVIASVYSEYWNTTTGDGDVLTAFEGIKGETSKLFFSYRPKKSYEDYGVSVPNGDNFFYDELKTYPVELYKLTYVGKTEEGQNYTFSDGLSNVTIGEEYPVIGSVASNMCSTVSGISQALDTSYVESVISGQTEITGDVSVEACADIEVKSEDGSATNFNSIVYTITPKIIIKGGDPEESVEVDINDDDFNGSQMTLTLCVGSMQPEKIIHHKTDGTEEVFYSEKSKNLEPGQKTFSIDEGNNGNFVTFTVDSFSDIEILAVTNDPITTGNATVPVPFAGQTPTFTAVSDDPTRYSVELLKWIDVENNKDITKTDLTSIASPYYNYKFKAGKKYEVLVRFTAAEGYELSYNNNFTINGEKTWWRSNGLIRTYVFVPNTDTAIDKNENKFTVTGYNIDGCTVILALYKKDSNGNSLLTETQNAVYDGKPLSFTATETDYTSAKVMVWDSLENMEPVTDIEVVDLGEGD